MCFSHSAQCFVHMSARMREFGVVGFACSVGRRLAARLVAALWWDGVVCAVGCRVIGLAVWFAVVLDRSVVSDLSNRGRRIRQREEQGWQDPAACRLERRTQGYGEAAARARRRRGIRRSVYRP